MKPRRERLKPEERKAQLLTASVVAARKHGYKTITRTHVAVQAKVTPPLVTYFLGDTEKIREEALRHAVKIAAVEVVAQGLAAGDPIAKAAPEKLKKRAIDSLNK